MRGSSSQLQSFVLQSLDPGMETSHEKSQMVSLDDRYQLGKSTAVVSVGLRLTLDLLLHLRRPWQLKARLASRRRLHIVLRGRRAPGRAKRAFRPEHFQPGGRILWQSSLQSVECSIRIHNMTRPLLSPFEQLNLPAPRPIR